jgi:hypothetical protein
MAQVQHVLICWQSIFLLAIEAGLAALPGVEVIRVGSRLPGAADRIAALEPDVIVVERDGRKAGLALELLERGFPVMEIDAADGALTILNGRRLSAHGIEDLAQAILRIAAIREIAAIRSIAALRQIDAIGELPPDTLDAGTTADIVRRTRPQAT